MRRNAKIDNFYKCEVTLLSLFGRAILASALLAVVPVLAADTCSLAAVQASPVSLPSSPIERLLDSFGMNLHIAQGYDAVSYIEPLKYLGIRQVRDGSRNTGRMIAVSRATGVRFSMIAGGDMENYLVAARSLAQTGALLAVEGPNEPNNFPIVYKGIKGGKTFGWMPVAEYQRDLYARVKADPILTGYPVFAPSEVGAETENVGLQYLKIPAGAQAILPDGTVFADYANVHNYVSAVHGGYGDNQAWNAADPVLRGRWDGLSGNNGTTWNRKFSGYSDAELVTLPRVTTETGYSAGSDPTEQHIQGVVLVNTYLAQFARGWAYTYIYELRDNEGGDSTQGLYAGDKPKLAADYIHNLTTILGRQSGQKDMSGSSDSPKPAVQLATDAPTVHALDFYKSDGTRVLVVWGERTTGRDFGRIDFGGIRQAVKLYDVTQSTAPVKTLQDVDHFCLEMTDHALIVEY